MTAPPDRGRKGLRETTAFWSPAILLFLAGLLWFDRHGPFERILYAGVFGLILQLFGMMAYAVAYFCVERLLGQDSDPRALNFDDPRVVAAVLLAASVYLMGQHWKREQSVRNQAVRSAAQG